MQVLMISRLRNDAKQAPRTLDTHRLRTFLDDIRYTVRIDTPNPWSATARPAAPTRPNGS